MHPDCKTILVEVNDNFEEQSNKVTSLLTNYGFTLRNKLHADMYNDDLLHSYSYNQIWVKN
jgi:hypothetical protein